MTVETARTEVDSLAIEFIDFNFDLPFDSINFNDLSALKWAISRTLGQH